MGILRSQRKLSALQYEESFKRLYADVRDRMARVPKRRRNDVARPLMHTMNLAYADILAITEDPIKGAKDAADVRYRAIIRAQEHILAIQKPLYVYWNICGDPDEKSMKPINDKKRAALAEKFNDVMKLLRGIQLKSTAYKLDEDRGERYVVYCTEKEIQGAQFLTVMRQLHRFTHTKLVRMSAAFRDAEAETLRWLVDDAWYHAIYGNKIIPANKEQYSWRRKHFSIAIADLYKMERPMLAVMSLEAYSNKEMTDWSDLLNETNRLLQAVQRSDKQRFAGLR